MPLFVLLACTSNPEEPTPDPVVDTGEAPTGPAWPQGAWEEGPPEDHGVDTDALETLRTYTFDSRHNTQALLVIKDGVLVGEFYEEGYDADSEVTSWSVAKSVVSALVGVGIREEVLHLDDPVGTYVSDWSEGPNEAITIRHMLEMRSGLDPNTTNEYGVYGEEPDQLAYSLDRVPVREPGLQFSYVNEDSMVLGEVLAQAFDTDFRDLAEAEIFGPIGLEGAWWTDGEGHALTYCCIDSTARDLARFGLLYSRGGTWEETRLVPEDFVSESTTGISYGGYYGLHWWTFGEIYTAIGYHGQYIYVMPEEDLVVVRFGLYERVGDERVRTGDNWHDTSDYGPLDGEHLTELVLALVD